jgi:hypothetical protein
MLDEHNNILKFRNRKINIESLLLYLFFIPQIYYYICDILSVFGFNVTSIIVYVLCLIISFFIYYKTIQNGAKNIIIVFFVYLCVVAYSLILSPEINIYLLPSSFGYGHLFFAVLLYIPAFLGALSSKDNKLMLKKAICFSDIILCLVIISFVIRVIIVKVGIVSMDYMTYAYYSLPSIFNCFYIGLHKRKLSLILSIIASIIVLLGGCRGALITLITFFMLYFFIYTTKNNMKKKIVIYLVMFISALITIFYIDSIFNTLDKILTTYAYRSRVLSTLMGNSFYDTESFIDMGGRITYWEKSISQISIIGAYGIFGDRIILNNNYSHNIVLEMMIDFGGAIGFIIFLSLCYIWIKAFIIARKLGEDFIIWCISSFSIIFVKMMVSASYLISIEFWFYLGLMFWISNKYVNKFDKIESEVLNHK